MNHRIEFYLNSTRKSSPLISTHYAMLYPQNGGRIVTYRDVTTLCERISRNLLDANPCREEQLRVNSEA